MYIVYNIDLFTRIIKMRKFIKWQNDTSTKKEGVNPTDIDSAGNDQDLDNIGMPYNDDAINQLNSSDKERDDLEKKYQKKLWDLINKNKHSDKNDTKYDDTLDKTIKDYLTKKTKLADEQAAKNEKIRSKIPIKTTSTHFIDDKKGMFTPRRDIKFNSGSADKSTDVIDKE